MKSPFADLANRFFTKEIWAVISQIVAYFHSLCPAKAEHMIHDKKSA